MTTALVKVPVRVPAVTYKRGSYVDRWGHSHPAIVVERSSYRKKVRRRKKTSKKWYSPKVHSGWRKSQTAVTRRKLVLEAHEGDLLSAARSMQALANVTQDSRTRELAVADARFLFKEYRRSR